MLEIKNVYKTYSSKNGVTHRALENVSLKFADKGLVFILGKSGSGKSTLLNLIGGLDDYDRGDICFNNQSFHSFKEEDFNHYRNTQIGFVFQDFNLINTLSVYDNVALSLDLQNKPNNSSIDDILKQMNLPTIKHVPALVQLRCREEYMKAVAGVRLDGEVTLYIDEEEICRERGEVQLTDYGLSGIPVFQLSRYASYALSDNKNVQVKLNVLPGFSEEEFKEFCTNRTVQNPEQTAEDFFLGICNKKLLLLFMKLAGIKPTDRINNISHESKLRMFGYMRNFLLNVTATNSFEQAQVCAGGLDMNAVDDNLQLKSYPGIYVVGELLDVDGRCGGYNLQWAFASGYVAGCNAAEGQAK